MRVRRFWAAIAVTASLTVIWIPTAAQADGGGRPLSAELSGVNEVPPADPDGAGTAVLRLNPGQQEICYQLQVTDIAPASAAHIHNAPAGVNGPVVVPLSAPTAGTSSACASVDRELVRAILTNPADYYVNVHNSEFPGGAIRGQLG
jgi:hypothetical protein